MKRRSAILARLDAHLELLGPAWQSALGGDLALNTPMRFLAAGYAHPHTPRRLGRARLTRFLGATLTAPGEKTTPPGCWTLPQTLVLRQRAEWRC